MTCRGWRVYVVDRKLPTTCQLSNCQHICWPQAAWNCHTRVTGKFSSHPTTHDFLSPWCEQRTTCSWHCTDTLWPRHMLKPLPTSGPQQIKNKTHTMIPACISVSHKPHIYQCFFIYLDHFPRQWLKSFNPIPSARGRLLFHRSDQLQLIKYGLRETKWTFNRDAMVAHRGGGETQITQALTLSILVTAWYRREKNPPPPKNWGVSSKF